MSPCKAGIGSCNGLYANANFDINVEFSVATGDTHCGEPFEYEVSKELRVTPPEVTEAVITAGFKARFDAGLKGKVKITLPA